jgi:hypothetical protein
MSLLVPQVGFHPSVTRKFTPEIINWSTVVFALDVAKFFIAGTVPIQYLSSLIASLYRVGQKLSKDTLGRISIANIIHKNLEIISTNTLEILNNTNTSILTP